MLNLYNIKHFTEKELLMKREVPEELHGNITPTIKILDQLRDDFGIPIFITSTYRSPEYNKKVGGSPNSLHLVFNAIDFKVKDKQLLGRIYGQLCIWDSEHFFKFLPKPGSMGIGFYPERFIHIDTRPILGRKAPARWKG